MTNQLKSVKKFHLDHFPVGTKILYENPTLDASDKSTRIYKDQMYQICEATVLGVGSNGPNSFILKIDKPCPTTKEDYSFINVSWIREVLTRGKGKAVTRPETPDPLAHTGKHSPFRKLKHHGKYQVWSLESLVAYLLKNDHRYVSYVGFMHVIDHDRLMAKLYEAYPTTAEGSWWKVYVINKKKFHRVFKRALSQSKTSRMKAQKAYDREMNDMYEEQLDYEIEMEYDIHDEDIIV